MKCLVVLAGLFMYKQSMVVLAGSSCVWPGLLHDGVTRQNQNLTLLKTLLVSSQRTVSFPQGFLQFPDRDVSPLPELWQRGPHTPSPMSSEPESSPLAPPLSGSAVDLWSCLAEWDAKEMGKLVAIVVYSQSRVRFFAIPWTIARQALLSMEFPRQEYWSGLPFPSPGDLLTQGLNPHLLNRQEDSLPLNHQGSRPGNACCTIKTIQSASCSPGTLHSCLQEDLVPHFPSFSSPATTQSSAPEDSYVFACDSAIWAGFPGRVLFLSWQGSPGATGSPLNVAHPHNWPVVLAGEWCLVGGISQGSHFFLHVASQRGSVKSPQKFGSVRMQTRQACSTRRQAFMCKHVLSLHFASHLLASHLPKRVPWPSLDSRRRRLRSTGARWLGGMVHRSRMPPEL